MTNSGKWNSYSSDGDCRPKKLPEQKLDIRAAIPETGSFPPLSYGFHSLPYSVNSYCWLQVTGPIIMPCGVEVNLTGKDQPCPNNGKCSAGVKECWVEKYEPAKEVGE